MTHELRTVKNERRQSVVGDNKLVKVEFLTKWNVLEIDLLPKYYIKWLNHWTSFIIVNWPIEQITFKYFKRGFLVDVTLLLFPIIIEHWLFLLSRKVPCVIDHKFDGQYLVLKRRFDEWSCSVNLLAEFFSLMKYNY